MAQSTKQQVKNRRIILEKRRRTSRIFFLVSAILLITIIAMASILRILGRQKPQARFMFLREDSLKRSYETTALIVRDEHVLESPIEGEFVPNFAQGSRVAKDQTVGQIVAPDELNRVNEMFKAESDVIDRRYELLFGEEGSEARRIAEKKDGEINEIFTRFYALDELQDTAALRTLSEALRLTLDQRSQDLAQVKFKDSEYQQALEHYESLRRLVENEATLVKAPESGILSYAIDGLEELTIEEVETKDNREIYDLLNSAPRGGNTGRTSFKEEEPLFKMIHGIRQYFICYLPSGLAEDLAVNQSITGQSLDLGMDFDSLVIRRVDETRQGTLLILEAKSGLERLAALRVSRLSLDLAQERGLKLPRQALIDFKPGKVEAKIKIVSGGFVKETRIRVLDFNEDYALIESAEDAPAEDADLIEASTMVVVNPAAVDVGDPIDQID